jgi:hypothetical protein
MIPPVKLATRLAAVLGLCTALVACGPAYRDYGGGGYGPSYGSYYDPSYAPSYSRSYSTPYYSAPAPRYEPRYEPRYSGGSWCSRHPGAARDGGPCDRDDNPPGPRGGPGTNWENPPGPAGGPGASPNRRSWRDRDGDGRPDYWRR